jgi:hypothetical protein
MVRSFDAETITLGDPDDDLDRSLQLVLGDRWDWGS